MHWKFFLTFSNLGQFWPWRRPWIHRSCAQVPARCLLQYWATGVWLSYMYWMMSISPVS